VGVRCVGAVERRVAVAVYADDLAVDRVCLPSIAIGMRPAIPIKKFLLKQLLIFPFVSFIHKQTGHCSSFSVQAKAGLIGENIAYFKIYASDNVVKCCKKFFKMKRRPAFWILENGVTIPAPLLYL
jgi:hypothetical protein